MPSAASRTSQSLACQLCEGRGPLWFFRNFASRDEDSISRNCKEFNKFIGQNQIAEQRHGIIESAALIMPALRLGHQEIAKHLDPRDCLQFFRVHEISVVGYRIRVAEELH